MKRLALVAGLLAILVSTAFGQASFLQAKIPFDFVVAGKTLPAGSYEFRAVNNFIQMRNQETGKTLEFGAVTRLAVDKTAEGTARISFDVQEGKHFIEAIWPAQDEGYLFHTVKGEHTHEIIRSK